MIKKLYESPEVEIEKFSLKNTVVFTLSDGLDAGGDQHEGTGGDSDGDFEF